jgi:hypothetical protein
MHSHRLRAVSLLAALAALFAMLAAAASAQAAPIRQIQLNVGTAPNGAKLALEAQPDKTVKLVPSNPNNPRQRWVETDLGTTSSYRVEAVLNGTINQCLREFPGSGDISELKVASCNTGLKRWQLRTGSIANTGVQIQNADTGRVIMSFFGAPVVLPKSIGDSVPDLSEWRLPMVGGSF